MRVLLSSIIYCITSRCWLSSVRGLNNDEIPGWGGPWPPHDDWYPHPATGAGIALCLCLDWHYFVHGRRIRPDVLPVGMKAVSANCYRCRSRASRKLPEDIEERTERRTILAYTEKRLHFLRLE